MKTLALALAISAPVPQQEITTVMHDLVDAKAMTSTLVRVREGGHDWVAGAGVRDVVSRKPVDASGYFRIGSVTKTFVATVLLQLADEGRLGLDDPIERHLPGALPKDRPVTVRQALNHTSGIFDYAGAGIPGWSARDFRPVETRYDQTPQELLAVGLSKPPYFREPGTGWHYSNTNYVVAALLVEKLTGKPYGEAIAERVLRPLKLQHTLIPGHNQAMPRPHAHGYAPYQGKMLDATRINPSLEFGAGEMISTTADLATFFDALLGGKLTSQASLKAMRETGANAYGLGLQEFKLSCGKSVYGHSGGIFGYVTYAVRSDEGRTLVMSGTPYTGEIGYDPLQRVFTSTFC